MHTPFASCVKICRFARDDEPSRAERSRAREPVAYPEAVAGDVVVEVRPDLARKRRLDQLGRLLVHVFHGTTKK